MTNVEKIKAALDTGCTKCELRRSSTHVCVGGRGNTHAPIVLIGEAPGAAEEQTGKPFMGRAGQFLNRMIVALGMADQVYITNVVKCRPPNNRKPTFDEIMTCYPYLTQELEIVRPRVIVLMGKVAMQFFEEEVQFDGWLSAGTHPFRQPELGSLRNVFIVPTWHPAYCLRRGQGAKNDFIRALRRARGKI